MSPTEPPDPKSHSEEPERTLGDTATENSVASATLLDSLKHTSGNQLGHAASKVERIPEEDPHKEIDLADQKGEHNIRNAKRRIIIWIIHAAGVCGCLLIAAVFIALLMAGWVYFDSALKTADGALGILSTIASWVAVAAVTMFVEERVRKFRE